MAMLVAKGHATTGAMPTWVAHAAAHSHDVILAQAAAMDLVWIHGPAARVWADIYGSYYYKGLCRCLGSG